LPPHADPAPPLADPTLPHAGPDAPLKILTFASRLLAQAGARGRGDSFEEREEEGIDVRSERKSSMAGARGGKRRRRRVRGGGEGAGGVSEEERRERTLGQSEEGDRVD
jgi:hypothetical protein